MISMKPIIVLFANLMCLPVMAQRDFRLVEQRNPWLNSGNAAALTTLSDSSIARATVAYQHDEGALDVMNEGKRCNTYCADIRAYSRLSTDIVVYGSAVYRNSKISQAAGSMLFAAKELMPFDITEVSQDNAGNKNMETFDINGAVGWRVWRSLSVGARFDYTAGTYAKHHDLRHSNTLMDLSARVNAFLALPHRSGIGAGMVYRRRTETLQFKTYGTTDKIYTTLIDYANGYGEYETFGTEGFTDSKIEQPLLSEYIGFTAQGAYAGILADITYTHRTGYYGRKSQYSASHEQHHGDCLTLHLRSDIARSNDRLLWIDLHMTTENLNSWRENYRRTIANNSTAVVYYEYFEPTKMADKALTYGSITANAWWKRAGDIVLWNVVGGVGYLTCRQTAYIYPDIHTIERHTVTPFLSASRSLLMRNNSLWTIRTWLSKATGDIHPLVAKASLTYEIPLHGTRLRPSLSADYCFRSVPCTTMNTIGITAAATV